MLFIKVSRIHSILLRFLYLGADFWIFPCQAPTLWTAQAFCPLQPLPGWHPWCGGYLGTRMRIPPHNYLLMMELQAHRKGQFSLLCSFLVNASQSFSPSWPRPTVLQASQTLGRWSGKSGPGESFSGASYPSLSKNQDDFLQPCWRFSHGGSIHRPGNFILFIFLIWQFNVFIFWFICHQMWKEFHPKLKGLKFMSN